jgi:hypothetical protein
MNRRNKYFNRRIEVDGYIFASKKEASIYQEFKLDPSIEIIEVQPRFTLIEPFKYRKHNIRGVYYTADFKIEINDITHIVEVKSKATAARADYILRKKLFFRTHPGLYFWEIVFDGKRRIDNIY